MFEKRIKDIGFSRVLSASPGVAISEAIELMRQKNLSCLLALERGKPVGIFTERNIVKCIAEKGMDFTRCTIRSVMSSSLITATEDMYVYEAFHLMVKNNIRHLVIINQSRDAVGVVTQSDIIEHVGYDCFLEVKSVSEIMTRIVTTMPCTSSFQQALQVLAKRTISCVVVVEDEKPVGILTERDIARRISNVGKGTEMPVSHYMSTPLLCILETATVFEAASKMISNQVRHLVVVNQEGQTVGLITQSDIVLGLESRYVDILKEIIRRKDRSLDETLRQLQEKTILLDNILTSSMDMGIVAVDRLHRVTYFNPAAEELFGYTSSDITGNTLEEIHTGENLELARL
ncbi:MAG: CBS domain-containing protein, partial [Desulfovibrionales bacterium]